MKDLFDNEITEDPRLRATQDAGTNAREVPEAEGSISIQACYRSACAVCVVQESDLQAARAAVLQMQDRWLFGFRGDRY